MPILVMRYIDEVDEGTRLLQIFQHLITIFIGQRLVSLDLLY